MGHAGQGERGCYRADLDESLRQQHDKRRQQQIAGIDQAHVQGVAGKAFTALGQNKEGGQTKQHSHR